MIFICLSRLALTVGKVLLVYEISMQVLPTAPSPTVTHFINLDALISSTDPLALQPPTLYVGRRPYAENNRRSSAYLRHKTESESDKP